MSSSGEPSSSIGELAEELLARVAGLDSESLPRAVSDDAVQRLLTASVRLYASKLDDEVALFPFADGETLTATEVGMTVGRMIKAADVDLFELVSWQSLRGH